MRPNREQLARKGGNLFRFPGGPAVRVRTDGTIIFNATAAAEFNFREGDRISTFYHRPSQTLVIRKVGETEGGMPLVATNNKGLKTEKALEFLGIFGVLMRTRTYPARWDSHKEFMVINMKGGKR